MSGREWKPGDVAMVSAYNRREEYRAYYDGKTWREYGADMFCVDEPMTLRPLLVIDTDDTEQIERLARCYVRTWSTRADGPHAETVAIVARQLADAIRDFTAPAKPPEPTGLGAVVEDREGTPWVRCENVDREPHWYARNKMRPYAEIHAVHILSEGVTP